MKLRVKEIARSKGIELQALAKRIGITYQALNARLIGNPTIKALQGIADALHCSIHELIEAPPGYSHFYDDTSGEWLGVRKK